MAYDDSIHTKNMDTITPLSFSLSKQWWQFENGSKNGTSDKNNKTTTIFALPIYKKHQRQKDDSNDGIHTNNYYACLNNSDTDDVQPW